MSVARTQSVGISPRTSLEAESLGALFQRFASAWHLVNDVRWGLSSRGFVLTFDLDN